MNQKLMRLAGEFLEQASEEYGNHGCNDWEWPKDFSNREITQIVREMEAWNIGKPVSELTPTEMEDIQDNIDHGPPDFYIMSYLAHLLKEGK